MNSQATVTRTAPKKFENKPETANGQTGKNQQKNQQVSAKAASAKTSAAKSLTNGLPAQKSQPAAQSTAPISAEGHETVFHLDAPSANTVLLAGEFTSWDKTPIKMIKGGGGVWHAKVALPPGRHPYRFLVDGQWQNDPVHHERVPNSFGSFNNVIEVR